LPTYESLTCKVNLSVRGRRNKHGKFDLGEAAIDAGIMSGLSFFTGLGGLAAGNSINPVTLTVVVCAAAVEFLSILAVKRRLIVKSC
jgi:hypothetical protein